MDAQYKVKGINSDSDVCNICGKTELQKVVWLSELDKDGNEMNVFAVGTTCAGKLLYGRKTKKNGEKVLSFARAINIAGIWAERGFDLETIGSGIFNKFGYLYEVKGNKLFLNLNTLTQVL